MLVSTHGKQLGRLSSSTARVAAEVSSQASEPAGATAGSYREDCGLIARSSAQTVMSRP